MSRTIADLPLGSVVVLLENGVNTNYILVNKDANGCEILRELAYGTTRRMNPTNTTVYETSEMDAYLSNEETGFLSLFDAATRSAISARSISTFTFGDTEAHYISRRCYLPSYGNMFLTVPTAAEPEASYLWALSDWEKTFDTGQMRIARNASNIAVSWWLRSPYSAANFYCMSGGGGSNANNASYAYSFRPALNVAPATIVSDEGADTIYLLPTERAQTVEFKGKLGEFNQKPTVGCTNVTSNNLTNVVVKVTNNYGDSVPTWQTVQDGVQFEFTNETKETENWQVGIWCYGEAVNLSQGYFEQPQMLVEVE